MSATTENIKKRFKDALLEDDEEYGNESSRKNYHTCAYKTTNGWASFICFAWAITCISFRIYATNSAKTWLETSLSSSVILGANTDWLLIITISVIAGFYFLSKTFKNK